jgi:hypothetical protein
MRPSSELYASTVPELIRGLERLLHFMAVARRHARKSKYNADVFLTSRLYPDMYTFIQQIQYAYFTALDFTRQLTARKPPKMKYDEKTYEDLIASIKKVLDYLRKLGPKDFAGAEQKTAAPYFTPKLQLPARAHARLVTLPNFYFHISTAYAILRHEGVPLGKKDFIGKLQRSRRK